MKDDNEGGCEGSDEGGGECSDEGVMNNEGLMKVWWRCDEGVMQVQ